MRRSLSLLVLMALTVGRGTAQQVEADPNKDYPVIAAAGEWMVLVSYYTGPEAESLARQMVYKIRAEHKLPAYVFMYIDQERKREKDRLDNANKMALELMRQSGEEPVNLKLKTIRVEAQYGVLIGGWADVETANVAVRAIRVIKNPPELVSTTGRTTTDTLIQAVVDAKGKPVMDANGQPKFERFRVNPFTTAIVTRNPSLPPQRAAQKADPALKQFNANEEFSLLNNPKPYTMLVKDYSGASAIQDTRDKKDEGFLSAIGLGGAKTGDALDKAALQARETARVLHEMKFEVYVLHTRSSSAVTIGGFDSPNDPRMQRIAQDLALIQAKTIEKTGRDPLQLYPRPPVMEVPRP